MLLPAEMNEMIRVLQQTVGRLENRVARLEAATFPADHVHPAQMSPYTLKDAAIGKHGVAARHERMAEAMHADNREYLLSEGMPATSVPIWPDTDPKMRARWRNLARVADAARGE